MVLLIPLAPVVAWLVLVLSALLLRRMDKSRNMPEMLAWAVAVTCLAVGGLLFAVLLLINGAAAL